MARVAVASGLRVKMALNRCQRMLKGFSIRSS